MFYLGVPISAASPRDFSRCPAGAKRMRRKDLIAVIHPIAATPEKTWPADYFLELARHLERTWIWNRCSSAGRR